MPNTIYYTKTALTGGGATALDYIDGALLADGDFAHVWISGTMYVYKLNGSSSASENSPWIIAPDTNPGTKRWYLQPAYSGAAGVANLKPAVNAAVNKLDIFAKSSGAVPDASNAITVSIPDGNGYTFRSRAAAYLSGTSQFVLADAANYWTKGSVAGEIKTAWLYAIWDGAGIVWALAGYSGFTITQTTTTPTDDNYFLVESGSTYVRNAAHYCVAVAKIRYEYGIADSPDHTIQASGRNAPQVIWNPRSDYGYPKSRTSAIIQEIDIAEQSIVSVVVKQSGKYSITAQMGGYSVGGNSNLYCAIKTGSATYESATVLRGAQQDGLGANVIATLNAQGIVYLNAGDTIHQGASLSGASGNRVIYGENTAPGRTGMSFCRVD